MRADAQMLMARLRDVYPSPAGLPFDLPAALFALAKVESDLELGRVGDFGRSYGMFQVHQPTWRTIVGAFSSAGTMQQRINYEVDYIRPIVADALQNMLLALGHLKATSNAGAPVTLTPDDFRDWINIIWQFGGATFLTWVRGGNYLPMQFPGHGSVTRGAYLVRLQQFRAAYLMMAIITAPIRTAMDMLRGMFMVGVSTAATSIIIMTLLLLAALYYASKSKGGRKIKDAAIPLAVLGAHLLLKG